VSALTYLRATLGSGVKNPDLEQKAHWGLTRGNESSQEETEAAEKDERPRSHSEPATALSHRFGEINSTPKRFHDRDSKVLNLQSSPLPI